MVTKSIEKLFSAALAIDDQDTRTGLFPFTGEQAFLWLASEVWVWRGSTGSEAGGFSWRGFE